MFKMFTYKLVKIFKEVRHYESIKPLNENDLLSNLINIGKNRKFNRIRNARYILKLRKNNKWTELITGLFNTNDNFIYYGDISKIINGRFVKKHLLIFVFSKNADEVKIYLYRNYYPKNKQELNNILEQYYKKQGATM